MWQWWCLSYACTPLGHHNNLWSLRFIWTQFTLVQNHSDFSLKLYWPFHNFLVSSFYFLVLTAVYPAPIYTPPVRTVPVDNDINNSTVSETLISVVPYVFLSNFLVQLQVFIPNLDPNVTEEELKQIFLQFREIISIKIPVTKGWGFLLFATRYVMKLLFQLQDNL